MERHGVIFDFNGVLVWDGDLHAQAWSHTARALRGAPLTPHELRDHVHGRTNRDILEYLASGPLSPAEVDAHAAAKEQRYRSLCLAQGTQFSLSPGATGLLDWLAARPIPRAIATSSGPDNLAFYQAQLRLDTWFTADQIVFDAGDLPGKPAPDIYLRAADRLGLAPQCCAVVEDSHAGIVAARAAGVGQIIALGPSEAHPALLALPGVHRAIPSLAEFPRGLLGPA
jgi:beta-phosphoglucomutase-like phosphatase (HAD superfamily)